MIRSFLALYPDPDSLERMKGIVEQLRNFNLPVRWERPDHIHITLKFMAEIDPEKLKEIAAALKEDLAATQAISMYINKLSAFPKIHKPRIMWLGGNWGPELPQIQASIEDLCDQFGIPREEKRFTPHFTVARVGKFEEITNLKNVYEAVSFKSFETSFGDVRIMESTLTPQGAIHTELDRIPFR